MSRPCALRQCTAGRTCSHKFDKFPVCVGIFVFHHRLYWKYISKTEIRAGEGSALCLNWCDSKEDVKNCDEGGVHANCGLRTEGEDYIGLDRILFFSHEYIITNCELLSWNHSKSFNLKVFHLGSKSDNTHLPCLSCYGKKKKTRNFSIKYPVWYLRSIIYIHSI